MASVLELPIEKQKEIAKRNNMSHEQWVEQKKMTIDKLDKFAKEVRENEGIRPEGMTEEDVARFQKKIDSGTPKD